jgi:hypothetical protein
MGARGLSLRTYPKDWPIRDRDREFKKPDGYGHLIPMPKTIPLKTRKAIIKMYKQRCALKEIADKYKCDPRTVKKTITTHEHDVYGIHPRTYERVVEKARTAHCDIETILFIILEKYKSIRKGGYLEDTRLVYRRRLRDLDQNILSDFINLAKGKGDINNFIISEIKNIRVVIE